MHNLRARYGGAIEQAIGRARESGFREIVEAHDGAEVYAYPHARGIAWGINAARTGVNILRGIRQQDGTDEAIS